MKRLIYSMYVHIPYDVIKTEHADCSLTREKTELTTNSMLLNYDWLYSSQKEYANKCEADYKLYEYDDNYIKFKDLYFKNRPYITTYNILNFYKIWLMYENTDYDEILYLDFDVIPMTDENIFEELDFKSGILCRVNHEGKVTVRDVNPQVVRSPRAKWWNTRELLLDEEFDGENDVYNTGVIGASKNQLQKLAYFKNFDDKLDMMHDKVNDTSYPNSIRSMFGYDNETLFSYLMQLNNVQLNELSRDWHFVMNHKFSFILETTKMVHVINKDFDYAKDYIQRMV